MELRQIKKLINQPLSDVDVKRMLMGRVKVLSYRQLKNYSSVEDLLQPYGRCIILIESSPGYGHWTSLIHRGINTIEWFDSFGIKPDLEKEQIDSGFLRRSGQGPNYLSKLLYGWSQAGGRVTYNSHKMQGSNSSVCGRWVVLRSMRSDLDNEDQFYRWVMRRSRELDLTPDEFVVLATTTDK